jgi:hypothetical protein
MCDRSHLTKEFSLNGARYTWSLVSPDMGTVTASDGRQKTTQVGGAPPEVLARLMAGELQREK